MKGKRLIFLDNLKVFLTMLVIAHHAGQAYGPTGGEWPIFNDTRSAILGPFFTINAAFFMGLFFLISGYFIPASLERKGSKLFLKDRFLMLGIPILLSVPLFILATGSAQVGHLWFLEHLLLYAVLYVIWQKLVHPPKEKLYKLPSRIQVLFFITGLIFITFLIRIFYPIDHWLNILGFFRIEMAHLPQYISLFIVGILSYRMKLFERIPTQVGMSFFCIGILLSLAYVLYVMNRNSLPLIMSPGGFTTPAFVGSLWETLVCVSLSLGFITFFREKFTTQNIFTKLLAQLAFIAYIIHIWIIVGLQMALADVSLDPLIKFLLVCLLGIPATFLASYGIFIIIKKITHLSKSNH